MPLREYAVKGLEMKGATVSTTVVPFSAFGFSSANVSVADQAVITARTAGVMVSWDGTDPTATLGHLIAQNETMIVTGNQKIQALKFIREAAADASVTITLEQATYRT